MDPNMTKYLIIAPDDRDEFLEDGGFTFATVERIQQLVSQKAMRPDYKILQTIEAETWEEAKNQYDAWWDNGLPGYYGEINRKIMSLPNPNKMEGDK